MHALYILYSIKCFLSNSFFFLTAEPTLAPYALAIKLHNSFLASYVYRKLQGKWYSYTYVRTYCSSMHAYLHEKAIFPEYDIPLNFHDTQVPILSFQFITWVNANAFLFAPINKKGNFFENTIYSLLSM